MFSCIQSLGPPLGRVGFLCAPVLTPPPSGAVPAGILRAWYQVHRVRGGRIQELLGPRCDIKPLISSPQNLLLSALHCRVCKRPTDGVLSRAGQCVPCEAGKYKNATGAGGCPPPASFHVDCPSFEEPDAFDWLLPEIYPRTPHPQQHLTTPRLWDLLLRGRQEQQG